MLLSHTSALPFSSALPVVLPLLLLLFCPPQFSGAQPPLLLPVLLPHAVGACHRPWRVEHLVQQSCVPEQNVRPLKHTCQDNHNNV